MLTEFDRVEGRSSIEVVNWKVSSTPFLLSRQESITITANNPNMSVVFRFDSLSSGGQKVSLGCLSRRRRWRKEKKFHFNFHGSLLPSLCPPSVCLNDHKKKLSYRSNKYFKNI